MIPQIDHFSKHGVSSLLRILITVEVTKEKPIVFEEDYVNIPTTNTINSNQVTIHVTIQSVNQNTQTQ